MPKEPRLTEECNSRSSDLEDDIAQRRLRELCEDDLVSRNTFLTVEEHIRVLRRESQHVISEMVGREASASGMVVTEGDEMEEEGYECDVDSDDSDESNDIDNNNNNISEIDDGDDLPDYIDDFVGMNVHARKKNIEHRVQEDDNDDDNDGDDEDDSSGSDEDEHYNTDNDEDYIRCNEE